MLDAASGTALFFRTPISDRSKVFPVSSGEEMREVQRNSFYMFKWLLPVLACVLSCFSHVWLHNPMGCSLSGSSVHGILQARILEWVAISFSGGTSWPRDQTRISVSPALAASSLPLAPPGKPYHCSFSRMYQGSGHRMIRASSMEWMPLIFHQLSPHTQKVKMSQNSTKINLHATQTEKTSPIPVPCQPGCSSVPV